MPRTKQAKPTKSVKVVNGKVTPKDRMSKMSKLGGIKRPHRWRPGTVALREIRKLQKTTNLLIPKRSFERVVREIAQKYKTDLRFTKNSIFCLQEASEAYLIETFQDSLNVMIAANKQTLKVRHMQCALKISKKSTTTL